jgi:primosomal protein N' (replication factor Y) (superfamily II helicase)
MQILKVIPTTKIPMPRNQLLTYFSSKDVQAGSLVKINLRNRNILALVMQAEHLKATKMNVRQANFSLKKIQEIVSNKEIIRKELRNLILWTGMYYWEPLGLLTKRILPTQSLKKWQQLDSYKNSLKPKKIRKYFYNNLNKKQLTKILSNLDKKEQVLFLYPEISKLKEAFNFFKENFNKEIALFHSNLKTREKWFNWKLIYEGRAQIILATRQGVFLPFLNLTKIIINEEDSSSYKSWDQHPKINAKHVAFKLAEIYGAQLILISQALSLETYWKLKAKHYQQKTTLFKPNFNKCRVIDMRQKLESNNFQYISQELQKFISQALKKKKKILLIQNRKGSATYVFCKDCGFFYKCPNCDTSLTYHEDKQKLVCHLCGHEENLPDVCAKCHGANLKYAGYGTQRLKKEIKTLFPTTQALLLDNDIAPTHEDKEKIYEEFLKNPQKNILVATKTILSLPLKKIFLVAFLNIDLIKNFPNFSINETTVQLIKNITNQSYHTLIQTYDIEDEILQLVKNNDYDTIYQNELAKRKSSSYPPFWQIIKLTYRHRKEKVSQQQASLLFNKLDKINKSKFTILLGPLPSNHPKIKNYYYNIIVLKIKRGHLKERNKFLKLVPASWDINIDPLEI